MAMRGLRPTASAISIFEKALVMLPVATVAHVDRIRVAMCITIFLSISVVVSDAAAAVAVVAPKTRRAAWR